MHPEVRQPTAVLRGRQVSLPLLVILVSHLLLMLTPLHDVLPLGPSAAHEAMDAHAVHVAIAECVGPAATDGYVGVDCAIRGNAPPRSGPGLLLASTPPGRPEPPALAGLLPEPPERSIWPPPLSDPQVLFQVFRL